MPKTMDKRRWVKSIWRPSGRRRWRKFWTGRLIVTIEESCRGGLLIRDRVYWLSLRRRSRDAAERDCALTGSAG